VNDVGSAIRTNVDESYRRGIELIAGVNITKKLNWQVNATFSENKINKYTETIVSYQYDEDFNYLGEELLTTELTDTDISFSPNVITGSDLSYTLLDKKDSKLSVSLLTKYVGEQFLDNASNEDKTIDAYLVNDAVVRYAIKNTFVKEFGISLMLNNIFSEEYSSNGYTYSYNTEIISPDNSRVNILEEQDAFYPQAPLNFLVQMDIKF
jgi:iron complex outermembrane receptor protein